MQSNYRMFDIFMSELKHQCKFAAKSYDEIVDSIGNHDSENMWYSIQSFLISTGNISKILYPPDKKCIKRGQDLRKLLNISNISPLKSREFRNHFEHYDERIQSWAETSGSFTFIDNLVTDKENFTNSPSLEKTSCLRYFITDNMILKFRGEKYELKPIGKAIVELYKTVTIKEEELRNKAIEDYRKNIKTP